MSAPHGRPKEHQPISGAAHPKSASSGRLRLPLRAQRRTAVTPFPGKGVGG